MTKLRKGRLATTASKSLSASLLALAILAAAVNQRAAQQKPEEPEPPRLNRAEAVDRLDRARSGSSSVVLPSPPDFSATPKSAVESGGQAAAFRKSEPKDRPRQIIKPLAARPRVSEPKATTEVVPLKPRTGTQASEVRPQRVPSMAEEVPVQEEEASQEPVEILELQQQDSSSVIEPGELASTEGRTVLRLLEHGSGPDVELAWPRQSSDRDRLYARLRACFGMQVALLDRQERMFIAKGDPGSPWDINTDRYSGFIRRPSGSLSREERLEATRIRNHHGELHQAHLVRVFPREVDALLLGGLRQLVGDDYADISSIRARYKLAGQGLFLEEIVADSRRFPGRINLSNAASKSCR